MPPPIPAVAPAPLPLSALEIWRLKLPGVRYAPAPSGAPRPNPLVVGDLVVASVMFPGKIIAVDRRTGQLRWEVELDSYGQDFVLFRDGILLARTSSSLLSLNPATGDVLWKFAPGPGLSPPVLHRGRLYLGDSRGGFLQLDARTGQWTGYCRVVRLPSAACTGMPALFGDVLVWTVGPRAVGISLSDGSRLWQTRLPDSSAREVLSVGGNAVIDTMNSITVLQPATGRILQRWTWRGWQTWDCANARHTIFLRRSLRSHGCSTVPPPEDFSPEPSGPAPRIVALRPGPDKTPLFDIPEPSLTTGLRYDPSTRILYHASPTAITALSPRTGRPRWQLSFEELNETRGIGPGLPALHDGVIHLLTPEGTLLALRHP